MFFSAEIDAHGAPRSMQYFRLAVTEHNTIN